MVTRSALANDAYISDFLLINDVVIADSPNEEKPEPAQDRGGMGN